MRIPPIEMPRPLRHARRALAACTLFLLGIGPAAAADEVKKISDNSFLVEEGYNQEEGVVQHIQTFLYIPKTKEWAYSFTQEWPLFGQTHQLSYTLPALHFTDGGVVTGLGDIALNYRYQLIDTGRLALAPRLTLLLPTGNWKKGLGVGAVGYQANLPLSWEVSDKIVTHWNAGATYTPNSRDSSGARANTVAANYSASAIYLVSEHFNLMLEAAGTAAQVVEPSGAKHVERTFFLNPGFRFSIDFASGLQIVPGLSVPIGLGPSRGTTGIYLYLSFEHPF